MHLPSDVSAINDSDFRPASFTKDTAAPKVHLGRLLFFDKILSGNKNIACATCHHPTLGTGDGLPLPIGEGGIGLGPARRVDPNHPVLGRVPRNSPPLYFAGAKSIRVMFHDGRIEPDTKGKFKSGFVSPAGQSLPQGLDNVLAVQAMFPVLSDKEMAGHKGENKIAAIAERKRGNWRKRGWNLIARRLRAIPEYVTLFKEAYPKIRHARNITYVHAANAIAAFEASAFRADQSPFDKFMKTKDTYHLSRATQRGLNLFYGRARCATCHAGPLLTDSKYYAIAMPQIGPGKGHGEDKTYMEATGFKAYLEDEGRYAVTKNKVDLFKFRTPSLRNVELTAPYGHAGAYKSLEAIIRHHADPVTALEKYNVADAGLPAIDALWAPVPSEKRKKFKRLNETHVASFNKRDKWVHENSQLRGRIGAANELKKTKLSDDDVGDLIAFLKSLTDPRSRDQSDLVPDKVPSGLPVKD